MLSVQRNAIGMGWIVYESQMAKWVHSKALRVHSAAVADLCVYNTEDFEGINEKEFQVEARKVEKSREICGKNLENH